MSSRRFRPRLGFPASLCAAKCGAPQGLRDTGPGFCGNEDVRGFDLLGLGVLGSGVLGFELWGFWVLDFVFRVFGYVTIVASPLGQVTDRVLPQL